MAGTIPKPAKLSPTDVHALILREFYAPDFVGVMVDVGAARPVVLSNGAPFRAQGWRIISIEPNPAFCAEYRQMGFDVIECACSDENKDDVDFTVVNLTGSAYRGQPLTYEGYSSLGLPGHYAEQLADMERRSNSIVGKINIKVRVRTLDTILTEHAADVNAFDVLSIAAGEWELHVLRGFSIDRYRPRIIVADNVSGDTSRADVITPHGYSLWNKFGPKEVFVRC